MLAGARRSTYRPDIDGLRAFAVLAVVAYHYGPGEVPGGFIGVDVFFVISGYLISSILLSDIADDHFSITRFYRRRIRRIFPALILILLACLIVGWFILFLGEYERLGKHVLASAGFAQNFALWAEAGYFDREAITKPMLHLWSLAVEEQFYIVWPLFLWLIAAKGRFPARWIGLVALVSFVWGVYVLFQGHDAAAFYSPLTRAWELSTGALLALWHRRNYQWLKEYSSVQSWLGLSLIFGGIALIRPQSMFPGFWALLPVMGTALVINSGPHVWANRVLLSNRPAVWVGLISYPLYLWHWVLLSFTTIAFGRLYDLGIGATGARIIKVALILASFGLAWLTYRLVERPLRFRLPANRATLGLLATMMAISGAGLFVFLSNGAPYRTFVQAQASSYVKTVEMSARSFGCMDLVTAEMNDSGWYCVLGAEEAATSIIVYGDSHAQAMFPALARYGREHDVRVVFAAVNGCPPLFGVTRTNAPHDQVSRCRALNRRVRSLASKGNFEAVVLISYWTTYMGAISRNELMTASLIRARSGESQRDAFADFKYGLRRTLAYYHGLGIPVLVLKDNPDQGQEIPMWMLRFGSVTDASINATAISAAEHESNQAAANRSIVEAGRLFANVQVLSITDALCNAARCPWVRQGKFLYHDTNHLSVTGAMAVYPVLERGLNRILE